MDKKYEIVMATEEDRDAILSLYRAQIGRVDCGGNVILVCDTIFI